MGRKPKLRKIISAGNHQATLIDIIDISNDEKDWGDRWRFDFESDKSDPETDAVVLIGEIGPSSVESLLHWYADHRGYADNPSGGVLCSFWPAWRLFMGRLQEPLHEPQADRSQPSLLRPLERPTDCSGH